MSTTFTLNRAMGGEQDKDYVAALTACQTVQDLRALVTVYRELAVDAVPVVAKMTAKDFTDWQRGLKLERRGTYAGDAWAKRFGAVLLPQPMMTITEIASQFTAPFGVAWHRCQDLRPDLLEVKRRRAVRP